MTTYIVDLLFTTFVTTFNSCFQLSTTIAEHSQGIQEEEEEQEEHQALFDCSAITNTDGKNNEQVNE